MGKHDAVEVNDYLLVTVTGELDQPYFRQITDEMLVICRDKDIHKVIIDVTATAGTFSATDPIEFAKYAAEVLKDDIAKYAYVYPRELLSYSSQVIAQGLGFNVKGFYSMETAREWIEASEENTSEGYTSQTR